RYHGHVVTPREPAAPDAGPARRPRGTAARPPRVSERGAATLALVALAGLWLIVPSGALVRLTGSGLGCPDWPLCDGGVIPASGAHAAIEYSNRVFSAVVMLLAVATWLVVRRLPGRPLLARRAAAGAALMTVGQVPLGGLTVLTDLHPLMVGSHFLLSMAALAAGVLTVVGLRDHLVGRERRWDARRGPFALGATLSLAAVLVTGVLVTAAGPHSGDSAVVGRFGQLDQAVWVHVRAVGVLLVLMAVLAVWLWRERPRDPSAGRLMAVLLPLLALQVTVGEVQYRTQLPWEVVTVHVSLAGLVWALGVAAGHALARPPVPVPSPPAGPRPVLPWDAARGEGARSGSAAPASAGAA
ncbi:MAG TPA: COX15/CtaA family protein, partial [Miltoncostaeaceae bacterium]|nr:COX15/CtaA family protein [Miltoncostaeaceae bacterium]